MEFRERVKQELEKLGADLAEERDALKVRAHLFKMEAQDEWKALEKKYEHFKSAQMPKIKQASEENAAELKEKMQHTSDEIKKGYNHLKERLKK